MTHIKRSKLISSTQVSGSLSLWLNTVRDRLERLLVHGRGFNYQDNLGLFGYYQAVIRSLLEYASVVWHSSLSKEQTKSLENVQRRVLQIILGNTSCDSVCRTLEIALLSDRRREHCESLFRQIARDESHVLHYLLPTERDSHITDRLRSAKTYPTLHVRTSRFQNSFIPYALTNLQ